MCENLLKRRNRWRESCPNSPLLLYSGKAPSRNYPAGHYPFRALSTFLYFVDESLSNAFLYLDEDRDLLFIDLPTIEDQVWEGSFGSQDFLEALLGVTIYPLKALTSYISKDCLWYVGWGEQKERIAGELSLNPLSLEREERMLRALTSLRLSHDEQALIQLKIACRLGAEAHRQVQVRDRSLEFCHEVKALLDFTYSVRDYVHSFEPIVTCHGEVLHTNDYTGELEPGQLLLVDSGCETRKGWASDLTRTMPVNGNFSPLQKDLYQLVLDAQKRAIERCAPGVEFRAIHEECVQFLGAGLLDLGFLKGDTPEGLFEKGAIQLFFPHGLGHLLGLDVHDMEDYGDIAGYAEGRQRSTRFGDKFLRLDRPLEEGMLVTIEPGFYYIPALFETEGKRDEVRDHICWDRLPELDKVRGIRIEDDILITSQGHENLTFAAPKEVEHLEQLAQAALKKQEWTSRT